MEAALGSLGILPMWYFGSLASGGHALEIVPWAGVVGLVLGIAWGTVKQQAPLCWFAVSPALTHVMVGIAFLFAGQMKLSPSYWVLSGFLLLQLAVLGYLVFRFKGMRIPAVSLSIFGMSYAVFAAYVGGMALTNTWL